MEDRWQFNKHTPDRTRRKIKPPISLIERFSALSGCCVSVLAVRKKDGGGSESSLPAFSVHPDKRPILESVMDADVKALVY